MVVSVQLVDVGLVLVSETRIVVQGNEVRVSNRNIIGQPLIDRFHEAIRLDRMRDGRGSELVSRMDAGIGSACPLDRAGRT